MATDDAARREGIRELTVQEIGVVAGGVGSSGNSSSLLCVVVSLIKKFEWLISLGNQYPYTGR